ncbi:maleylpyruvate isomerase family mycothiol-dependent enzyme [Saccharomonospora iraqiensis]|uniref:maleylpyruvate isomerase family mycothiol-dependent enzyme n=1 Tax=Saccharomonospora iraqiensis TaxID=52698 RepID=UPI00022DF893|nr:maleylpyruvate isomerase family mycothiol-dependent enzyme [Saccharomonospora iraqiensis]
MAVFERTRRFAREERTELARYLRTLTPQQWDTESLCAGWRVRDVVAHAISYDELGPRALFDRARRGRSLAAMNEIGVAEYTTLPTEELVALLERHADPRGFHGISGGVSALEDGLIHHQDIRRALGHHREIPADRLVTTLRLALLAPPLGALLRIRGLRLVATDVDWSAGRGRIVQGPGEALLMAMAGRTGVVEELTGPGQPILASRIGK